MGLEEAVSKAIILLGGLVLGQEYSCPFQSLSYHKNPLTFLNSENENFQEKNQDLY